jgi:tetratricopeptide (TPR) repeat protein
MLFMKKLILGMLSLLLVAGSINAQDAKGLEKDANRALGKFNLDQSGAKDQLGVAVEAIDKAIEADSNYLDAWQTRGEIYSTIATQIVTDRQLGMGLSEGLPEVEKPAVTAFNAYAKALEMVEKRRDRKKAVSGMQALQGTLSNKGIFHYEDKEYSIAYENFDALLKSHEILQGMGEESGLKEEDFNRQLYITGLAALNAEMMDKAEMLFQKLYDMEYDEPAIYEALYTIKSEKTSPEDAYPVLEKGKRLYPEDVSLLFAEINHYLKLGQSEKLIDKLKLAIDAEPENPSLYSVLGNAYETIYQKRAREGKEDEAQEAFNQALSYYDQARELDDTNITAIYSAGALYYNRAAQLTQKMLELQDDYSKEGIEKYNEMRDQVIAEFDKALPYFKQVEQIAPDDVNTLIALKEIYAKKDDIEMSNVFKDRLEKVQAGDEVESYFKNN